MHDQLKWQQHQPGESTTRCLPALLAGLPGSFVGCSFQTNSFTARLPAGFMMPANKSGKRVLLSRRRRRHWLCFYLCQAATFCLLNGCLSSKSEKTTTRSQQARARRIVSSSLLLFAAAAAAAATTDLRVSETAAPSSGFDSGIASDRNGSGGGNGWILVTRENGFVQRQS